MTKIKTLAKNTGNDSLPVFLTSVLILVALVTRTENDIKLGSLTAPFQTEICPEFKGTLWEGK